MSDPDYVERQEGPDGQYCLLLTRYPYAQASAIEAAFEETRGVSKRKEAILRNSVFEASVKDYLTGEPAGSDLDVADPDMVADWRERAANLFVEWRGKARPKGKAGMAPVKNETSSSDDSPPQAQSA